MQSSHYNQLLRTCFSIKRRILTMYYKAKAGHIGSSLSCAEIITAAFFEWMQPGDEFVLSKGHAAACLYSALAEKGFLSEHQIDLFYKEGIFLPAHPPCRSIPQIPFATRSLGHRLSLAAGVAKAKINRIRKSLDILFKFR